MFQYAAAKQLAVQNGDTYKLDLSFYRKYKLREYQLKFFNTEDNIATERECIRLRGKEEIFHKLQRRLGLPIRRPHSYVRESSQTNPEAFLSYHRSGDLYLDGHWQSQGYFSQIAHLLTKEFTTKANLSRSASGYLQQIRSVNSVSLHIRRGDYVNNARAHALHGVLPPTYYKKATATIIGFLADPTFFIFSDDIPWSRANMSLPGQTVFIEYTKHPTEDLELMKHCKHNIVANSSFSWWGAWLNPNRSKIVTAPRYWFKQPKRSSHRIVPPQWITL